MTAQPHDLPDPTAPPLPDVNRVAPDDEAVALSPNQTPELDEGDC